jgi:hypothetical protein
MDDTTNATLTTANTTNTGSSSVEKEEQTRAAISATLPPRRGDGGGDDISSSSESTQDEFDFIESTWENGVETGLTIQWPSSHRPLVLSTKLTEDLIAPLFDGTQWAGTRVWKAAVVALEYLLQEYPSLRTQSNDTTSKGASLLEVGCGLGVPAMLWHLLQETMNSDEEEGEDCSASITSFPPRVVLTDMPDLLPQLEANVQGNFADYYGKSIQAKAFDWSAQGLRDLWKEEALVLKQAHDEATTTDTQTPSPSPRVFDICLNCDCIYEQLYGRESWQALADVLAEVARVSPSTLLVTSVERRNGDGLEDFLQRLEASGTVQRPIQRALRIDDDPHHVIEIYVARGRSD